jgi:small subunit ribosomal protein S6
MEFYETTYILHPALQEGRLNDTIKIIEKKVESFGAEIIYSENWGRKKLSYLIDKEKYGTYIHFQFRIKNLSKIKELSSEFDHNPNILRYLSIRINEEDLSEKNKELEEENIEKKDAGDITDNNTKKDVKEEE